MSLRIKKVEGSGVKEGKHITAALSKQGYDAAAITAKLAYTKLVLEDDANATEDSKLVQEMKAQFAEWAERLEKVGFTAAAAFLLEGNAAVKAILSVENQSVAHLRSIGITEEQVAPISREDVEA